MSNDPSAIQQFTGRVIADAASAAFVTMVHIGDQLGIYRAMARKGAMTSAELARASGLSERHVREWLAAMVAGEYVTCDSSAKTYTLPDHHAAVLADEEGMFFLGGVVGFSAGLAPALPRVMEAFRTGRGVDQDAYGHDFFCSCERSTAPLYTHVLPGMLIPKLGAAKDRLEAGGTMLDVGCGAGRACLSVAKAFPRARVVGYDRHEHSIERARANAQAEGLAERVTFDAIDCTSLPRNEFDLITAFDVLHDAPDPLALLTSMHDALKPDGVSLVQEFATSAEPHENVNVAGKFMYSQSAQYCLNVSLAANGPGLGSLMGEAKIRELASEARFASVEKLPVPHPVFSFYVLRR